jgi:hypothetical protein
LSHVTRLVFDLVTLVLWRSLSHAPVVICPWGKCAEGHQRSLPYVQRLINEERLCQLLSLRGINAGVWPQPELTLHGRRHAIRGHPERGGQLVPAEGLRLPLRFPSRNVFAWRGDTRIDHWFTHLYPYDFTR